MIYVISDFNNVVGIVKLPPGTKINELRKLYEKQLGLRPNPHKYDTPEQNEWIKEIRLREQEFADKYNIESTVIHKNGEAIEKRYFGAETFYGWLVKEFGGKPVKYRDYVMAEFD